MAEINVTVNGKKARVEKGSTILKACQAAGFSVPTLCHDDRLKKFGGCRVCLVEVEGMPSPAVSCSIEAADGMVINTATEKIEHHRKTIIELLLSDHPNDCMTCQSSGDCTLQDLAYKYNLRQEQNRFTGTRRKIEPEVVNPFIIRDYEKCILCGKCVRVCDEVIGIGAITSMGRGFYSKIATSFDQPLDCIFCGICIEVCPVGALREKNAEGKGRKHETEETKTVCTYCGVGCGINLHVKKDENKIIKVTGELNNPSNNGFLCVKGKFGFEFVNSPERLTVPLIKRNGKFEEASWEEAIQFTAGRLSEIKNNYGPDTIGGLSSAKCTNEDNYVFQKFIRAVIGTNNVDHCARLCHSPSATGLLMAFGGGAMTNSTDDFLTAETIFIIGSNTTETHPVSALKLLKAVRENGTKLIVADPRKTRAAGYADIWLNVKPGTNTVLLNGMMNIILKEELYDKKFISERTENFEEFRKCVEKYDIDRVEKITEIPKENIINAARLYAKSKGSAIYYGMGVTQHTQGTETVLLLAALAMMTGNVGKPGAGVNPLRGQNNVQGACDMGALPNIFPGYASVSNEEAAAKFENLWNAGLSRKPGLTATEMVEKMHNKEIRALYIMGENPLMSDPNINHAKQSFQELDFLVVQDIFLTETAQFADVILPATSFAEKDGTVTNTDRRVQRVRKAIKPVGDSKTDLDILKLLSAAMDYKMEFETAEDVWNEVRSIWPAVTGISYHRIEDTGLQWPCPDTNHPGTTYLYKDSFIKGKGKFFPVEHQVPAELPDAEYPLLLSTGRILSQFHTGGMTRKSEPINNYCPEGFAEMHPEDAVTYGITDLDLIKVSSRRGKINIKVKLTNSRKGMIFIPFHFAEAAANILTNDALDKYSKIAEFKVCAVKIEKI